ncbi:MAG TPA: hypothetical protein VES97_11375 [Solirubrobacteraceae bacterium]|nr:hypothetical protein [Solirubrobacteraceae bacterium]
MPDEQPIRDPLERARQTELDILYALTNPEDNQPLWTLEDLAREMGEPEVINYIGPLQRAGLVHRTADGHVFASRAAVRQIQLVGHGVI